MGLTYSSVIDADRDEVFSWHTRPGAITRLIPPWQPVRVFREAGSVRDGHATLSLPGGLRWVAAHRPDGYDPPNAFADELTSLPLPWRHTHQFSPAGQGTTLVTDVIETPLPARMLRSTVVYRHRQLAADLAWPHWPASRGTPCPVHGRHSGLPANRIGRVLAGPDIPYEIRRDQSGGPAASNTRS